MIDKVLWGLAPSKDDSLGFDLITRSARANSAGVGATAVEEKRSGSAIVS